MSQPKIPLRLTLHRKSKLEIADNSPRTEAKMETILVDLYGTLQEYRVQGYFDSRLNYQIDSTAYHPLHESLEREYYELYCTNKSFLDIGLDGSLQIDEHTKFSINFDDFLSKHHPEYCAKGHLNETGVLALTKQTKGEKCYVD